MPMTCDPRRRLAWVVPVLSLLALSGCSRGKAPFNEALEGVADRIDLLDSPTIQAIGEGAILTYEPGKPVEIRIQGNSLHDPDLSWSIGVTGIAPLVQDVDFRLRKDPEALDKIRHSALRVDALAVVLESSYIDRVHSGDPLTVSIQLVDNRLARRYHNVRSTVVKLEAVLGGLRRLYSAAMAWNLQAAAGPAPEGAVAAKPIEFPDEGAAPADLQLPPQELLQRPVSSAAQARVLFAQAMGYFTAALATFSEATTEARSTLVDTMDFCRSLDPTAADFPKRFSELEHQLADLRSYYKQFLRTHVGVAPVVASASRRFVLFSAEDYRQKFIGSTVPLNEISAFPLPEQQARRLFGPVVASEFFVVALSLSNFTENDRLIDTGMIKASGRALICPPKGSSLGVPVFNYSVPIEMVPQSTEQVYTLVSDTKLSQPREWFFRSLEFAGALATAAATGFQADLDLVKGLGLFSGVAIPGAKQLWPDDVPGYMRNIIAFGMPDLVKINGKSTVGHKVLFFSKEKLQLMVSDPMQFRYDEDKGLKHPEQYVVQLAFDSLMVTFDNITSPTKGTVEERMAAVRRVLEERLVEMRQVAQAWTGAAGDAYARQLRWEDWLELAQWLSLAQTAGPAETLTPQERRQMQDLLQAWRQVHGRLAPEVVKSDLTNHERIGINALTRYQQEIESAQAAVATGQAARIFSPRVENAERMAELATRAQSYNRMAAGMLADIHRRSLFTQPLKGATREAARNAYAMLRERLAKLAEEGKPVRDLLLLPTVPPELPEAKP